MHKTPSILMYLTICLDLHEASQLFSKSLSTLPFLPPSHTAAFATYVRSLAPSQSSPHEAFFAAFLALYSNIEAILDALGRPLQTVARIAAVRRDVERNYSSLSRASRWPPLGLALLDESRQRRLHDEREERARRSEDEAERLCRELRYAQQTVAGELAGWREMHERLGRRAIRDLARGMVIAEKTRLEGMRRALRLVREGVGTGSAEAVGIGCSPRLDGHRGETSGS